MHTDRFTHSEAELITGCKDKVGNPVLYYKTKGTVYTLIFTWGHIAPTKSLTDRQYTNSHKSVHLLAPGIKIYYLTFHLASRSLSSFSSTLTTDLLFCLTTNEPY